MSTAPHDTDAPSTLPTAASDPVAPVLRDVLAVFDDALADVRFPDVDGATLHAAAVVVESAHAEVRRLEVALEEARRRLDDAQDALLGRAQRGVAYARIYADGDAALTARLDALVLPRARATRSTTPSSSAAEAPRKRRRSAAAAESLFAVPTGDDVDGDDVRAAQ
jgi:hypothetical protein